jgi:hypothetical protein
VPPVQWASRTSGLRRRLPLPMQSSTAGGNRPRSRSREGMSASSLAGMPGGLADTRAVVARDISGPRYFRKGRKRGPFSWVDAGSLLIVVPAGYQTPSLASWNRGTGA